MSEHTGLEKCLAYIDCHLHAPQAVAPLPSTLKRPPAVTISRQTGAGGISMADRLAEFLEIQLPGSGCPWTVFHKNLVTRVLEDHDLPKRLARYMPEDKVSSVADAVEELLGLHPPSWKLVHQATETIIQLAELGNVILVGRGANVATAHLPHVFHVRLVGSLEKRIRRVQAYYEFSRRAAAAFVKKEDDGRRRYVRRYFRCDIEDPLRYHLVLNTDWITPENAAWIVGVAMLRHFGVSVPVGTAR